MPMMGRLIAGSLLVLATLCTPAAAQYPTRPIVVIVPFAAGGPTDVVARIVGDHMSQTLGQQLVVENIAGAGGTTGMTRVAQAPPMATPSASAIWERSPRPSFIPQSQVQSGHELRPDRHLQLHSPGDRGQKGNRGQGPQGIHCVPQGQFCKVELWPCRGRFHLPRLGHSIQCAVRPKACAGGLSRRSACPQ